MDFKTISNIFFLSQTISLCQQMEKCGVTFITVHGRTPSQKITQPSNNELLREVKQSISIPMIANGDCKSLNDADEIHRLTKCDGVMAARGILANPTLFSGKFDSTPLECVQEWLNICHAADQKIVYPVFHHHLTFMMEKLVRRKQRAMFNLYSQRQQVYDYIADEFCLRPQSIDVPENIKCVYDDKNFQNRLDDLKIEEEKQKREQYDTENSLGKFFLEKAREDFEDSDSDIGEVLHSNFFNSD